MRRTRYLKDRDSDINGQSSAMLRTAQYDDQYKLIFSSQRETRLKSRRNTCSLDHPPCTTDTLPVPNKTSNYRCVDNSYKMVLRCDCLSKSYYAWRCRHILPAVNVHTLHTRKCFQRANSFVRCLLVNFLTRHAKIAGGYVTIYDFIYRSFTLMTSSTVTAVRGGVTPDPWSWCCSLSASNSSQVSELITMHLLVT